MARKGPIRSPRRRHAYIVSTGSQRHAYRASMDANEGQSASTFCRELCRRTFQGCLRIPCCHFLCLKCILPKCYDHDSDSEEEGDDGYGSSHVVLSGVTPTGITNEQPRSTRTSTVDNETYRLLEQPTDKSQPPTYVNVTDLLEGTNGAVSSVVPPSRISKSSNNKNSVPTSDSDDRSSNAGTFAHVSTQPDVVQSTQYCRTGNDVRCEDTIPVSVTEVVQESTSVTYANSLQAQACLPNSQASGESSRAVSRLKTITVGSRRLPILETDL